jgi:hypothetical protein
MNNTLAYLQDFANKTAVFKTLIMRLYALFVYVIYRIKFLKNNRYFILSQ